MAKFKAEIPADVVDTLTNIYDNYDRIVGQMTRAGAEKVYQNVKDNLPSGIRDSEMIHCLKISKTYKTPSDDGINTKVGIWGYFKNKDGKVTPAPLVANVFEYGRSGLPFPTQPFFRKAFKGKEIEKILLEEQEKAMNEVVKK